MTDTTTQRWTVYTLHYDAPRSDGRLKAGERTFLHASSIGEVAEKMSHRGIDVEAHHAVLIAEHFTQSSTVEQLRAEGVKA